jgi:hypothetical protein
MNMTTDDTLHKTWEFKGIEIKPLPRARRFHLTKLVDFSKVSPWDIAVLIFALSCDQAELMKGLRNPEWFDGKVSEWIESAKLEMEDFNEESLAIIREVMEHSEENKAKPIADPNMMEDPMGNG